MNYKVYQGDELKQTVTSKIAVMNGLQPNQTYVFGVQPNDGTRDGKKATTSVTTRGIRFNIPKELTVGSTITLRYEEYPLGIVPIGNEPSGMFGGGNKQNLSAKVISTANGSSVVEVAGNVIDVGNKNLIPGTSNAQDQFHAITGTSPRDADYDVTHIWNLPLEKDTDYTASFWVKTSENTNIWSYLYDSGSNGNYADGSTINQATTDYTRVVMHFHNGNNTATPNFIPVRIRKMGATVWLYGIKFEKGDIATPYASFVDGDTFTAQPDGTYALFSEYKALYY